MDKQQDLIRRIEDLEKIVYALTNSTTIPKDVDGAFRERFLKNIPLTSASTVTVLSKTQSVNEGGSASYDVAKPMTAIIQVKIGSNTYNFADYS